MWQVENTTSFVASHAWVRDRRGAETWIVAVRGTFDIRRDGTTEPSEKQEPVSELPAYRDDPAKSSMLSDTDLLLTKTSTDVLLQGHAYAPDATPRREVDVSLRVGTLSKQLRVFGDRLWVRGTTGLTLSRPRPFVQMPLVWERAFGGADPKAEPNQPAWCSRNPVGLGYALRESSLENRQAPNIEDPAALIRNWNDHPTPAGFGPIAYHWSPRIEHAGTHDAAWKKTRFPLVPNDFDDRFYQCAPPDQRAPKFLRGGEPVELLNLSPQGPLRFRLPKVAFGFETHFYTGEKTSHNAQLHTVVLDPDKNRVMLVWHSALSAHAKVLKLDRTVVFEKEIV